VQCGPATQPDRAWTPCRLFRNLPQLVVVCRPIRHDGAVTDLLVEAVNEAVERTGPELPFQARPGQRMSTMVGRAFLAGYLPLCDEVISTGQSRAFERLSVPGGYAYAASLVPAGDDRIAIIATDITEQRAAEEALQASETTYRAALEALHDGILVEDALGRIISASGSAARILGMPADSLAGRSVMEAPWHARREDGTPVAPADFAGCIALRTGRPVRDLLFELVFQDGRRLWARFNAEPLRDGAGTVCGVVVSLEDVTERRDAERALAASEERYRSLLDDMTEGVQILDRDWRWVYLNRAAAEHHGGELAGVVGRRLLDVMPSLAGTELHARIVRCMEDRLADRLESSLRFADGTVGWFVFSLRPVPEGVFVLTVDVTDRHLGEEQRQRREAELRRTTAELEEARELAGLGTWRRDLRTGEAEWSPRMFEILGLDPAGPPPSPEVADGWLDAETVRKRTEALLESARTGLPWELEVPVHPPGGDTRWAVWRGRTESDAAGRPIAVHGTALDTTVRKRAENVLREFSQDLERRVAQRTAALEAANDELRSFSYSVSHDLRAPVRAIAGFARLLELRNGGQLDEQGRHRLQNVITAAESMGRVIDDLLAYSRVGRGAMRAQAASLEPLVENVRTACAAALEASGGMIEVEEPLAVPTADPTLLGSILQNLVQNALTYRRAEVPPVVRIRAVAHGDEVVVCVTDNGMGIPADGLETIFEPFRRLVTDEAYPGTGIGLAIVRRSARAMGGDVSVVSTPGTGSTFSVRLPRD
jgi:PAS domain S-box-containing protein